MCERCKKHEALMVEYRAVIADLTSKSKQFDTMTCDEIVYLKAVDLLKKAMERAEREHALALDSVYE